MPIPDYGAAPLAKTFVLVRGLSIICMIAIVGMTANFVSQIVSTNNEPPREVVGTLTVTCLATLYTLISLPIFLSTASLGLLAMTALDFLLLLAFVVVSVVLGKPVSYLNCPLINNVSAAQNAANANAFTQAIAANINTSGARLGLRNWAGASRTNCYEVKAVWGMSICLAVLFCTSATVLPLLWMKAKKAARGPAKGEA